jgi:hypothetical protein
MRRNSPAFDSGKITQAIVNQIKNEFQPLRIDASKVGDSESYSEHLQSFRSEPYKKVVQIGDSQFQIKVPPRLGPSKNLYQFTKLRDDYKQKYIETYQSTTVIDHKLNGFKSHNFRTSPAPAKSMDLPGF